MLYRILNNRIPIKNLHSDIGCRFFIEYGPGCRVEKSNPITRNTQKMLLNPGNFKIILNDAYYIHAYLGDNSSTNYGVNNFPA